MPNDKFQNGKDIDKDPAACAAMTAMRTLDAEGVVLLVLGGPFDSEAKVLCDPKDAAKLVAGLNRTLKALEEAAAHHARSQTTGLS